MTDTDSKRAIATALVCQPCWVSCMNDTRTNPVCISRIFHGNWIRHPWAFWEIEDGVHDWRHFTNLVITFYTLNQWTLLTAQMTCSGGIHFAYAYMVSITTFIFSLFYPQKCEKLYYAICQLRTAITRALKKIQAICLHKTGGFRG